MKKLFLASLLFLLLCLPSFGSEVVYTIAVSPLAGFTGDVTLTVSGLPSGVFATVTPSVITGGTGTSDLAVDVPTGITKGVYPITITGTSGALTHTASVTLVVLAQKPKFVSRKLIDLIGDNPGVTIPVRSKDGKIPFTYSLIENPVAFTFNNQWVINTQMVGVSSPPLVYYAPQYLPAPAAGQAPIAPLPAYTQSIADTVSATPPAITIGTPSSDQGWFFVDSNFVSHFFDVSGIVGSTITSDGSGYTLSASGSTTVLCQVAPCPTIVDVGGNVLANNNNIKTTFRGNVASFTDPDGVGLSAYFAGDPAQTVVYKDTLGQAVMTAAETNATSIPPNGSLPTNQYTYTAKGTTQRYTVFYQQFYQSTNFGCPGISEMPRTPVYLPITVTLPDGTFYSIQYEPTPGATGDVTGRISLVRNPTGGQTTYIYRGANNGINCTDGSIPVLVRTNPDGTLTYTHTLN